MSCLGSRVSRVESFGLCAVSSARLRNRSSGVRQLAMFPFHWQRTHSLLVERTEDNEPGSGQHDRDRDQNLPAHYFPHTVDRAERLNCRKPAFGSASESEEMHYKTYPSSIKSSVTSAIHRSTAIPIMFTRKAGVEALSGVHGCVRCCRKCNKESEDRETHDCWNGGDARCCFVTSSALHFLYISTVSGRPPQPNGRSCTASCATPCAALPFMRTAV